MKSETRRAILAALSARRRGLTIIEVAEEAGITRQTAAKYLDALHEDDRVERRRVGPAKLHYSTEVDG